MGGILGRRAWERSNGGLWLPNVLWSPMQMGFCCCQTCTATMCNVDGLPFGTAPDPANIDVTVSGITGGDQCAFDNGVWEGMGYDQGVSDTDDNDVEYCGWSLSTASNPFGTNRVDILFFGCPSTCTRSIWGARYRAGNTYIYYQYGGWDDTNVDVTLWENANAPWPETGSATLTWYRTINNYNGCSVEDSTIELTW